MWLLNDLDGDSDFLIGVFDVPIVADIEKLPLLSSLLLPITNEFEERWWFSKVDEPVLDFIFGWFSVFVDSFERFDGFCCELRWCTNGDKVFFISVDVGVGTIEFRWMKLASNCSFDENDEGDFSASVANKTFLELVTLLFLPRAYDSATPSKLLLVLIEKLLLLSLSLLLDNDDVRVIGDIPRLTVSAPIKENLKKIIMNIDKE